MEFAPRVNGTLQVKLSPLMAAGAPLHVKLASPESGSLMIPEITSGDVKTLAPFVREVILSAGGVLSSFTVMSVLAVFPALSRATPVTGCPAVSVLTATGSGHVAMPLVVSEQVKLTIALELFHPAALGAGVTTPVIVGATLSTPIIWILRLSPGEPRMSIVN